VIHSNKNLFLIVTDYPYGIGEPFLEDEILILSKHFDKIYIVIPEINSINKSMKRFIIPENCQLIELNTSNKIKFKILALINLLGGNSFQEILNIKFKYKQKITLNHLKTIIGFKSMSLSFKYELIEYLKLNNIKFNNSVFYSYWFTYATLGLALLKKEIKTINVTTRIHGWDCFFYRNKLNYLPFRPFVMENINSICPISETGRQHLIEKTKTKFSNKIHTHFLGIGNIPIHLKSNFNLNKIHILSIAFIDPIKRLDRIANALKMITNFEVEWTHIGNEPNNSKSFQIKIENELKENKNIKTSFLGELTKAQIYNFLNTEKPDLLICTSASEGIPVSMMEALAHCIPILSLNVGGVSEIVKDNLNGFLLDSDADEKIIAQKIIEFQHLSIDKRKSLIEEAFQFYLNNFSAEKNYFRFLKQELLHE
jgi:glycosyltransferase involved in cell wall biosynthesis